MNGPIQKKQKKPAAAAASGAKSAAADARAAFGSGHDNFYARAPNLAAVARSVPTDVDGKKRKAEAVAAVQTIVKRAKAETDFKQEISKRVRVKAKKPVGAMKGRGLDEMLQTSRTADLLAQSAGLAPGKQATFKMRVDGVEREVTLLEAQQYLRVPTSTVVFPGGGGHTGALRESLRAPAMSPPARMEFTRLAPRRASTAATTPATKPCAAWSRTST